jgi:hypothetical protein
MKKTIVVTGCDANHYPLAAELLASLQADSALTYDIGFVRLGDAPLPPSITGGADVLVGVAAPVLIKPDEGFQLAHEAVKARLPELFPGYDIYIWLDADTWVQNPIGLAQIAETALLADISINSQADPNYFTCLAPDDYTLSVYRVMFGADDRQRFGRFPMINCGVFGATALSPLWAAWKAALIDVRQRLAGSEVRFFSDQIPLHRLIYSGVVSMHPLRAVNNWLVLHSLPRLDRTSGQLTAPSFPYEPINIVHLVGQSKWQEYPLDGRPTSLRYSSVKNLVR